MNYLQTIFIAVYLLLMLPFNALAENSTIEFRLASQDKTAKSILYKINNQNIYVEPDIVLDIKHIERAELDIQKHQKSNKPLVMIDIFLKKEGQDILQNVTTENIGKILALFIEGKLVLAPKIVAPVGVGNISVGGAFEEQEAKDIVNNINKNSV